MQTLIRVILHHLLENYLHIGHQSYFVSSEAIKAFEKLHFETVRVGAVREDMKVLEPKLRNIDGLSFDLCSIRYSDNPGVFQPLPFGFTAEEACQLTWYAGLSDKLTSMGIYGYNIDHDHLGLSATIVGTMVWYFIEGYYHRKDSMDFDSNDYIAYFTKVESEEIVFYKPVKVSFCRVFSRKALQR